MSITPIVYPLIDQQGVEVKPEIYAIFDFQIEEGSVNSDNCFLIKKTSQYQNNVVEPVSASVRLERLNLLSDDIYEGRDDGSDEDSGNLYRSKIILTPSFPLEPHSEYSVVLSQEISATTVFDIVQGETNAGDIPRLKGPFKGFVEDNYTLTITLSGTEKNARYSWIRSSDSYEEIDISARQRFLELDEGIFIKFPHGDYVEGDTFTIKTIPENKLNSTFAWDFTTGDESYEEPEDETSSTVISLPLEDNPVASSSGEFYLISASPYEGATMIDPGAKATAIVNGIVFTTNEKTEDFEGKIIKFLPGVSLSLYELDGEIIFEIVEGVTSHQEILDILSSSTFELTATSSIPTALVATHESGVTLSGGSKPISIVFEFSKNLDSDSISAEQISVIAESLLSLEKGKIDFTHEIDENKLIIKLK